MTVTQYIGARYVPLFSDPIEWNITKDYEPLTIVSYQGNSYTSKQAVPANIDILNSKYWALTGNYNAQVESYRTEVKNYQGQVTDAVAKVETDLKEQTNKVTSQLETQNTNVAAQLETQNTNVATQLETQNTNVATQLSNNKTYVDTEIGKVSNYREAIVKCALLNSDLNRPIFFPAGTWFDGSTVPRTPETVPPNTAKSFPVSVKIYFRSRDLFEVVKNSPEDYIGYTAKLINDRYLGVSSSFIIPGGSYNYICGSSEGVIQKWENALTTIPENVTLNLTNYRPKENQYNSEWDTSNNIGIMELTSPTNVVVSNMSEVEYHCYPSVEGKIQLTYEDIFSTYANLV